MLSDFLRMLENHVHQLDTDTGLRFGKLTFRQIKHSFLENVKMWVKNIQARKGNSVIRKEVNEKRLIDLLLL